MQTACVSLTNKHVRTAGTPLDLNAAILTSIRSAPGVATTEVPPADQKQPAWKPYLYRGKQKLVFSVHETVTAALYDRDDVADVVCVSGKVLCRADLEGLPDVTVQVTCPRLGGAGGGGSGSALTLHPCAQAPEEAAQSGGASAAAAAVDTRRVTFAPPLGNFVLARYQAPLVSSAGGHKLPLQGFYQLSMVADDEAAVLIRMKLMDGYKSHMVLEHCTLTMPFPRRKVLSVDGTPSSGAVAVAERLVEWRVAAGARSIFSKAAEEVTFSGTIKFAPQQPPPGGGDAPAEEDRYALRPEEEAELVGSANKNGSSRLNKCVGDYFDGDVGNGLSAVEWEEPFTWDAYSYAKVSESEKQARGRTLLGCCRLLRLVE